MEIKNQIKITLPEMSKGYFMCEVDMPLGQIYDFSCAFKNFIFSKIQEAQSAENCNSSEPQAEQTPVEE